MRNEWAQDLRMTIAADGSELPPEVCFLAGDESPNP